MLGFMLGVGLAWLHPKYDRLPFAAFEKQILAFEKQDRRQPPVRGGIVFVGSSSIRLWKLEASFPDRAVINRGFGGSQISDCVRCFPRIVLPYRPNVIVFYAGDNDLGSGKSPQRVADDFARFADLVSNHLPQSKLIYIGIKPSIARRHLIDKVREANRLIAALCAKAPQKRVFIDVEPVMLAADGTPIKELFVKDGLHLSEEGYARWTALVAPHLGAKR